MRRYTAIDLFSGAGGLSEGLRSAGFDIIAASELMPVYAATHQYNHPETLLYQGDIRELSIERVMADTRLQPGDLDLLAGGPPCQGFSINAPIRSMVDARNHLFLEFLRLVDSLRPKTILIENVPGIISIEKGIVVKAIHQAMNELGYKIHHKILFAAHYGVPQTRWRTIFLASREDISLPDFPYPTHRALGVSNFTSSKELSFRLPPETPMFPSIFLPQTTVADALADLPVLPNAGGKEEMDYDAPPLSDYQARLREESSSLFNHRAAAVHAINMERMRYVGPGGSWRDIPYELLPEGMKRARRSDHTKRYGRLHPQGLASTILTKCDPHWGSFFHYNQDRVISVREAARLQSFPDRFRFLGALVQQYQQVGNAVPPILGQVIGANIVAALENSNPIINAFELLAASVAD